jgi:hypothetical protein
MKSARFQVATAFVLLLGLSVAASCNDRSLSKARPAPADAAPTDAAADLAGWTPNRDAGVSCFGITCGPNQVCVGPCGPALPCDMAGGSGSGSCTPPPFCYDLPSSCRSHVTCACFATDPCSLGANSGTCSGIQDGILRCGMCPI